MNSLPQQGSMETIAHSEGLKHFLKTGRVLEAILHAEHIMVCSMHSSINQTIMV